MDSKTSKSIVFCLVLLAATALATPQKPSAISLLPAPVWSLVNSQTLGLDAVRGWNGDPAIEREYGVQSLERRTYTLLSAGKSVDVMIENAPDPSAAYGLLTYYQTESMVPERELGLAMRSQDGTLMARGRTFIRIAKPGGIGSDAVREGVAGRPARSEGFQLSPAELRALLTAVGTLKTSQTFAGLPTAPLAAGLVAGSEKYILGPEAARRILPALPADLIGFSQGAEVEAAAYGSGRERATVVAITYPTPQISRIRFGAMEHFLGINQEHGPGSLYGKRRGSFVFLILGANSPATATRLMDQLEVSEQISWNQKYPGDDTIWVQVAKLILANMALVGILVGFAVLSGVLLFFSRRLAAKWFPTSPWGHPDEGRIIRLNLS